MAHPEKTWAWRPGDDDAEDLTRSDEENDDAAIQLRKSLGIPEMDPDALPSSMLNKYLKLVITCKDPTRPAANLS